MIIVKIGHNIIIQNARYLDVIEINIFFGVSNSLHIWIIIKQCCHLPCLMLCTEPVCKRWRVMQNGAITHCPAA